MIFSFHSEDTQEKEQDGLSEVSSEWNEKIIFRGPSCPRCASILECLLQDMQEEEEKEQQEQEQEPEEETKSTEIPILLRYVFLLLLITNLARVLSPVSCYDKTR